MNSVRSTGEVSRQHHWCPHEYLSIFMSLLYLFLTIYVLVVINNHRKRKSRGNISDVENIENKKGFGLYWYLVCTGLLCFFRFTTFVLVPFNHSLNHDNLLSCTDIASSSWQWELNGLQSIIEYRSHIGVLVVMLSSMCTVLFFSAYTYFAYSLARLLDMMTETHNKRYNMFGFQDSNAYSGSHSSAMSQTGRDFSYFLFILNITVWVTLVLLWIFATLLPEHIHYIGYPGQVVIATAIFTISFYFISQFLMTFLLLYVWKGSSYTESARVQLMGILKYPRVIGVAVIVTMIYTVRSLQLLLDWPWNATLEMLYFLIVEVLPTLYMLYVFQTSQEQQLERNKQGSSNSDGEGTLLGSTFSRNTGAMNGAPLTAGSRGNRYATGNINNISAYQKKMRANSILGSANIFSPMFFAVEEEEHISLLHGQTVPSRSNNGGLRNANFTAQEDFLDSLSRDEDDLNTSSHSNSLMMQEELDMNASSHDMLDL